MTAKQRIASYLRRLALSLDNVPPPKPPEPEFKSGTNDYVDLEPAFRQIYARCKPFTMTSVESMYGLHRAVNYVVQQHLPGALVECGVWRGGSMMNIVSSLIQAGDLERDVYLFDTFQGMSKPTDDDVNWNGTDGMGKWETGYKSDEMNTWAYASLDEVRHNVLSTGYPEKRLHFVQGKVEDTIPGTLPGGIALLRLDTDFYESTRHELLHLYPLLVSGGVLIIDDYGHWRGSRKAVDEYFEANQIRMLLNRVDYTCRLGVKL